MSSNRIALAIVCAAFACAPSLAADVPIEVKSEFRQNVVKRDRLVRQLASIDSKAADAVVAGKAPVALHAQQTELQDKIDLLQLRIETMAVRWNLDIPQPPKPGSEDMDESVLSEKRIDTAFTIVEFTRISIRMPFNNRRIPGRDATSCRAAVPAASSIARSGLAKRSAGGASPSASGLRPVNIAVSRFRRSTSR
jgi:hypothetical protein